MPKGLSTVGRVFYAAGLLSIGLMHFFFTNFPGVTVPEFPAWIPLRLFWIFVVGAALTAAGVAILFNWKGRKIAAWTGVALLLLLLVAHIPYDATSQYRAVLGAWGNAFKVTTLAGGAWIAARSLPKQDGDAPAWLERLFPLGRYFFGIMLVVFGFEHFLYSKFVVSLVPAWVGSGAFWTYFAGIALIAGGIGLMMKRTARLASLLVGVMIFLWVWMLHVPRAIVDPYTNVGNEWASVFEALAFSGIAFMLSAEQER